MRAYVAYFTYLTYYCAGDWSGIMQSEVKYRLTGVATPDFTRWLERRQFDFKVGGEEVEVRALPFVHYFCCLFLL